ncbi:hypothetical protein [Paenibacillus sp. PL91]|uniref:hypothetical protein n=1 Tax=Paenibacillus sp. PL91 TaxID=2729538 RepID=UPI00145F718D|nr:hypothetical protein [Paenibacillus sp. PL91]MBC9203661.1 hypothetical protein [Paenibacillus sp. PL91]
MLEFSVITESFKKGLEKAEATKDWTEFEKLEPMGDTDAYLNEMPKEEQTVLDASELYMADDIGLQAKTAEYGDPSHIRGIRSENEKVDVVLSKQEEVLQGPASDLSMQRAYETLERYKGTIFEYELKDTMKTSFEKIEDKQQIVPTEYGETKPDIIARGATEDLKIGTLEIKQGEDLFVEAKCGSSDYIRSEMGHVLKQVEGHDGNSLVVVTKDYLELSPEIRAGFEQRLTEKGSHIYVADIKSTDISIGLRNSLNL